MERMRALDASRATRQQSHRPRSDLSLTLAPSTPPPPATGTAAHNHHLSNLSSLKPEDRGIQLIQLLQTCAAHASSSDLARADACLRLISALSSHTGDSMQRLIARLASSLATRLLRHRWGGILSALHPLPPSPTSDPKAHLAFARALPYIPFTHAVAARIILRALAHERVVHLVDLGATHASIDLWAPVLRTLSRVPRGLRLTCVSPDAGVLESLGSALAKEAETLNVPFQFNPVSSSMRELALDTLRVRAGEALAVASVMNLHELLDDPQDGNHCTEEEGEAGGSSKPIRRRKEERAERFLASLRSMSPKVVVMVEQESEHNIGRMAERFGEVLHYYSAVFDSVESAAAGGLMTGEERAAVEVMLGREMDNVVACEGEERVERHEKAEKWVERMGRVGFRQCRVWNDAGDEGRKVVESWPGDGRYSVAIYYNCPMICWHDRPLYAVSAWQCI